MGTSSTLGRAVAVAVSAAGAVLVSAACYGPTEVRVHISTEDVPCRAPRPAGDTTPSRPVRTTLKIGTEAEDPDVDTTDCRDVGIGADIGTMVILPSGDRDARVTLQVTAKADGSDPEACSRRGATTAELAECIVARRSFAFIKHTARPLPIRLYARCKGVICESTDTCGRLGVCEPAEVVEDATGCIASECPGADASIPADGAVDGGPDVADALDSAVGPLCFLPNKTNELLTNVDLSDINDTLVGNSSRLFWIKTGPAQGDMVRSLPTNVAQPDGPTTIFSLGATPLTALAADETGLWVATPSKLHRRDLTPAAAHAGWDLADTKAIVTTVTSAPGAPVATSTYVTTSTTGAGGYSVYRIDIPGGVLVPLAGAKSGDLIATAPSAATSFFVFTGPLGPLSRHAIPWADSMEYVSFSADSVTGMAAHGKSLFYANVPATAGSATMRRLDESLGVGGTTTSLMYPVNSPGLVAVDDSSVFFQQHGVGGGILRGSKDPANKVDVVKLGFAEVRGLVINRACVYFWSTSKLDGSHSLSVYPKL